MKIKVTGYNGYIGQMVSNELRRRGHSVSGIRRDVLYGSVTKLSDEIRDCDIIINLAGAPILQRWTEKNRRNIYESRVTTTKNIVNAINNLPAQERPNKFISSSAIGIYKTGDDHDETSSNFDDGFLGTVVKDWEAASNELPKDVQRIIFRLGLVIGKNAKTIKNLKLPFLLGLGGKIGTGRQAFPFIHEKDVVNAFIWAAEDFSENSVFNLAAPENISNAEFTQIFAKQMRRPAFIPVPSIVLKLFLGKVSTLLLESPTVAPQALLSNSFKFEHPTIESSLKEILE